MKPQLHRHLSDLRTGLLLRARISVAGHELVAKADDCILALNEARLLFARHGAGTKVRELLARIGALLDELDECLLILAHDEDRAVFTQLELLRSTWRELGDCCST